MKVELIDHMGSDLSVVNAARVSFGRHTDTLRDADKKLLRYLATHGHWSPFAHPQLSFRISASIAVARQLWRHTKGILPDPVVEHLPEPEHDIDPVPNEVSRRYVKDEPTFDLPDVWRSAPGEGQSKQGSGEAHKEQNQINQIVEHAFIRMQSAYKTMIDAGVAPEQARLVLPMATVTEWIWTGSLYAFIRVCKERLAPDAQAETKDVAVCIYGFLCDYYPASVEAWDVVQV